MARIAGKESLDPLEITLTVVSGRNFHGRKKDICNASIVFGLGKELYQTETISSNEPYWNQEAHVNVTGKVNESLLFKIKDSGHTVGIVKIPIVSVSTQQYEEWHKVKPYKKEKEFQGEIKLICFVSNFRMIPRSPTSSSSGSNEDMLVDKRKTIMTPVTMLSAKEDTPTASYSGNNDYSDEDDLLLPEVTGISPNEGSIEGNERIILRGSNLGESKDDIVRVSIANIDCTNTLEYFSSGKLVILHICLFGTFSASCANHSRLVSKPHNADYCIIIITTGKLAVKTLPRESPGKGPVVIETCSGGVGVSSLHYSYILPKVTNETSNNEANLCHKSTPTDQEMSEILSEHVSMKQQIKELNESMRSLHEENSALKEYLDRLLSTIIEHNPELLEIAQLKKKQT